ncbi:hypothetical protein V2J09_014399 [Rumex salicifolius]
MASAEIIAAEEPQMPSNPTDNGGTARYILLQGGRANDSSFADGFSHHYIEQKAEKLGKSEAESKPIDMESDKCTIFKKPIDCSLKESELNTTRQEM